MGDLCGKHKLKTGLSALLGGNRKVHAQSNSEAWKWLLV